MGLQRKMGTGIKNLGMAAIERKDHVALRRKGEDHTVLREKERRTMWF